MTGRCPLSIIYFLLSIAGTIPMNDPYRISSLTELERLYGPPKKTARQESDRIEPAFQAFIEKAPFMVLATNGSDGLDASAKGDAGGFVQVRDAKTLLVPERGANGRNDSLRNIVTDPRVALIFLVPGTPELLRICGKAHVSVDPELVARFFAGPGTVRSVVVVQVEEAFFQCTRALQRAGLWDAAF